MAQCLFLYFSCYSLLGLYRGKVLVNLNLGKRGMLCPYFAGLMCQDLVAVGGESH